MPVKFIANITGQSSLLQALALSLFLLTTHAQAEKFSEDQIKAVFLFNFATFIRWPDDAFIATDTPFHFCALTDQTPIIQSLIQVISGESHQGRKLVFKLIKPLDDLNMDDVSTCQILFFHPQELEQFSLLVQALSQFRILTVSDAENFIEKGGMVALIHTDHRLRPMIHNKRLQQSGLKASSKLLQLAKIVE